MNCIVFGELLSVLLHNKTRCTAEATNYDSVSELHLFNVFKLKTLKENKRSKECENESWNIKIQEMEKLGPSHTKAPMTPAT